MKENHHRRFFVEEGEINGGTFSSSRKDFVNQIKNVFRLKKGDIFYVLDGGGSEFEVRICFMDKNKVDGEIINCSSFTNRNETKINLFLPLIKGSNFDLVLEKCTELGVNSFFPVIYDKSIVHSDKSKERWRKILKESAEQSEKFFIPEIYAPISFDRAMENYEEGLSLVADETKAPAISHYKKNIEQNTVINVFVGPEGGFSEKERDVMVGKEFSFFNLKGGVLRSETACIVSIGVLKNM